MAVILTLFPLTATIMDTARLSPSTRIPKQSVLISFNQYNVELSKINFIYFFTTAIEITMTTFSRNIGYGNKDAIA